MPHGITQCYLPPGRGDIPALTSAEAGTRLSDPEERICSEVRGIHAVSPEEKESYGWEGFAVKEGFKPGMKE